MSIEDRLSAIEQRNARVEVDKAWETSRTRRLSIAIITYAVAAFVMKFALGVSDWYLGALVPAVGYLLSTASLPLIRTVWEKRR